MAQLLRVETLYPLVSPTRPGKLYYYSLRSCLGHTFGLCYLAQLDSRQNQQCCYSRAPCAHGPLFLCKCSSTSAIAASIHTYSLMSICFPLIQSKLFAVFQKILEMSDVLMAFFQNTALDLFRISFLSFLRFGLNKAAGCVTLFCNFFSFGC